MSAPSESIPAYFADYPAIDPAQYDAQLQHKLRALEADFAALALPQPTVVPSAPTGFRLRAEFQVKWRDGQREYVMFTPGDKRQAFVVREFLPGGPTIQALMTPLREQFNADPLLGEKLFQVEFLTTLSGEALVTLIYHKPLDDAWAARARQLMTELNCHIIGRSRKQRLVLAQDYVTETLTVAGREFHYRQIENSFTQPNGAVNQQMITWALAQLPADHHQSDLLELYCGNGNFSLPLATRSRQVMATEISKTAVRALNANLAMNGINNVKTARLAAEEVTQALDEVREFKRLQQADIELDDYAFATLMVDPPRAGLDQATLNLARRFPRILYVSCNPVTLRENLTALADSHQVTAFAVFDQFPFTPHLECGVCLQAR